MLVMIGLPFFAAAGASLSALAADGHYGEPGAEAGRVPCSHHGLDGRAIRGG
jgi:hypothetical protein